MNNRFLPEINAINQAISEFNQYLNPAHVLPVFNFDRMLQEKNCIQILHGQWDSFGYPNSTKRGVYFVFGYEKNTTLKNGTYIGKASFSSAIGNRLDAHLRPYKNKDHFEMNGYDNEKYVLDYMASIDLDALNLAFFAPALEEFLISKLRSQIHLINGTGN